MAEFRPVPEGDRAALDRMLRYAFAPQLGPDIEPPSGPWPPKFYDQRGLYEDGTLVGSCKLYTLEARVRGEFHPLGGLGAVAVPPERRDEGYARELCREAIREFRDASVGLVALWPVSTPLYRRFGWAVANDYTRFDLHPDVLPHHDAVGEFVALDAEDWERLRRVETAFGAGTALSLRRSESWWRERTLANWDGAGTPYCYGYERDGNLAGYVVYTVEDDETKTLSVQDLAHVDEEAHRAMLEFLGRHGAQVERILLRRAAEADLLHRVEEPKAVTCQRKTGPMVRLTDVATLERFDWPATDAEWTMAVADPLCPETEGPYRVGVADGAATVTPTEDEEGADIEVDVGTLSQLAVGTQGIEAAERVGGLAVAAEGVREKLSAVFDPGPVCLREYF